MKPISASHRLKTARAYVAASNAHDIPAITPLLAHTCRYVSSGVGEHVGRSAILEMMQSFFAANPDVHWQASNYELDCEGRAVFDFTITLGGQSFPGREKISYSEEGLITLIEVIR